MYILKLTAMGDGFGVVFPDDLLARLQVKEGDELYWTETPDGLRITTHRMEVEKQMQIGREIMTQYSAVLHELAK